MCVFKCYPALKTLLDIWSFPCVRNSPHPSHLPWNAPPQCHHAHARGEVSNMRRRRVGGNQLLARNGWLSGAAEVRFLAPEVRMWAVVSRLSGRDGPSLLFWYCSPEVVLVYRAFKGGSSIPQNILLYIPFHLMYEMGLWSVFLFDKRKQENVSSYQTRHHLWTASTWDLKGVYLHSLSSHSVAHTSHSISPWLIMWNYQCMVLKQKIKQQQKLCRDLITSSTAKEENSCSAL